MCFLGDMFKKSLSSDKILYQINDPTTPDLRVEVSPPASPRPRINVKGYAGGGHPFGSAKAQAANCYVTLAVTTNYFQQLIKNKQVNRWPGTSILKAIPRAGVQLNAYYDRRHLKFFYGTNPSTQ
jgi:hypothetical protein